MSFNARDELGDIIDKLTVMMGRLAARDSNDKRPFKALIYKSRGSYPHSQNRNYNQRNYQNRSRLGNRSGSRDRGQCGQGSNRCRFQEHYRGNNFQKNTRGYGRKIVEGNIEMIGMMVTIEVGTDIEKGHFQEIIAIIGIEVLVIAD